MNIPTLIITGGLLAMGIQLLLIDGVAGWIASRIILRPWQQINQVLAIRYLYCFMYSTCAILWVLCMIYVGLLDK